MAHKPTIAVLMPGEMFHRRYLVAWTNLLLSGLGDGYDIAPLFGYSSNVHTTRGALAMDLLNAPSNVQIDYVLWIDDDNIVEPTHLKRLLSILQSHPDIDIACGWCYIAGDEATGRVARVSCGMWVKGRHAQESFSPESMELGASRGQLMVAEWTGFPCVMMRMDVLRKLGSHPFCAIISDEFLHGQAGEDLSFCMRAEQVGLRIVVDPAVKVEHLKVLPVPDPEKPKVIDLVTAPLQLVKRTARKLVFSICHTSARPKKWFPAFAWWKDRASSDLLKSHFEYVLCVDKRWGFSHDEDEYNHVNTVVWNEGRKCAVDGWNTAFSHATGDVLIMAADDFFPPENWDMLLSDAIGNRDPQTEDFAIRVNTDNPNQARNLFALIISRSRYKRLGYACWPEYDCMYSDDDYCEHILMDVAEGRSTLIEARHIQFIEKHPSFSGEPTDEVYDYQNRREGWTIGAEVIARRRASRFSSAPEELKVMAL